MSAGAIGGATAGTSTATKASGFGDIDSGQFMKILLSEMSNQDPFKPQDSGALLEQLSSLRNIESQLSLQKQLENLVLQNGLSSAAGMIGKEIEGIDANNDQVSGVVTSVRVEDGKAILELSSGKALSIERVTAIKDVSAN
jgi:flagellar basal-body rod modification protein FlgD